jgi:dipeptidyl aminopeptidase/acylaminoacyl peptidase
MKSRSLRALMASWCLSTAAAAPAAAPHVPTLMESLSRPIIRSPAISPDGRWVAYRIRETDWKKNQFTWQLAVVNVATGRSVQLTRGLHSAGSPEWSPDSRWLAFITDREGDVIEAAEDADKPAAGKTAAKQIWVIAPDGGEAWPLTRSETDVQDLHWSKDGKAMLFTAAWPSGRSRKARTDRFSDYTVVEKDFDQQAIWRVALTDTLPVPAPIPAAQLTRDPVLNVMAFTDSPDSTKIVFAATRTPLLADAIDEDLYCIEVAQSNTISRIVALPGPDSAPLFSPDGREVAFVTSLAQPNYYYANRHLALVDLDKVLRSPAVTPGDVTDLTGGFDENPEVFAWTARGIHFGADQKMATHLFRLDPGSRRTERVTSGDAWVLDEASVTPDGRFTAFIAEDATHAAELYLMDGVNAAPRPLTAFTAALDGWTLGTVEVVSWKSKDGTPIEGVLHKPADYDPKRRYPLLVKIHGGPTGTSQPRYLPPDYAYPVQAFLAKGALVLEPNYRGSAGYGAAFRALNVRNLGVGDQWDVLSGIDSLISRGIVDPNRLAAMGWSQGGYISAFMTTHTHRFKAISVGAGISDWTTYYVSTDITPFTPQYLHATPWDDPGVYAKTSPITTIREARTPTLIQHGSEDKRVPVPNAFELYRGLQDQKVDAKLILYNGFGHGIDKPKSILALERANLDWFSHYLWNEPVPPDSPLRGSSEVEEKKDGDHEDATAR